MLQSSQEFPEVPAEIFYLDEPAASDPTRGLEFHVPHEERSNMRLKQYELGIRDGRSSKDRFSLDRQGFCLADHHSAVQDFEDHDEILRVQKPELEELVRQMTGAVATFCVGIQIRHAETSPRAVRHFNSLPARFVHGDFFGNSGQDVLSRVWPDADLARYSRCAIYNAWRVITPPPQDTPLAVCDIRGVSVGESEEITAVLEQVEGEPFTFTMAGYHHQPEHQWYYFSQMTPEEVLIFKTFDTSCVGVGVPHTAFDDRSCYPNGIPRGSIEARIMTVFA